MDKIKHSIVQAKHSRMMVGLGFKGGVRNYATYLRKLATSNRWNKLHHAAGCAATLKYYNKVAAELGVRSSSVRPMYAMNHAAEHLQERKDRANEARKELLRLQHLRPNRRGGRSTSPLTIEL